MKAKVVGHIAGFDFNPDRVCMVMIDQKGNIRLVKYARDHGVKILLY